ncbi:MAG: stage 0 sporulation family protein [Chloroflexi bacterium]|nr:stage 0 sporulation family protein [Chloroflexota bacterium]
MRAVGVRFKRVGRVFYFDAGELDLQVNDFVICDTLKGLELGRVVVAPDQMIESELSGEVRPVVRLAEARDLDLQDRYRQREVDALARCAQKVAAHGLPMKLLDAEYSFDGSRLTFYFAAEGRVDFRQLVRDLAGTFRTRIDLRQVGARDEAKLRGGIGPCGRPLCCATWLSNFEPVTMKMAKEQDLPLNPEKLAGICGRLRCCLAFEVGTYVECKRRLPQVGEGVESDFGPGVIAGVNVLKETVAVRLANDTVVELAVHQLRRPVCDRCSR